jgi:hypothetical protein
MNPVARRLETHRSVPYTGFAVMEEPPATARPRNANRGMWIAIGVLVVLWATAMLFRWEIRARWWGYRLAHAESPQSRGYYFACLASIGDRAVGAAGGLLRNPSPEIRMEAVGILHRCRSAKARGLLLEAMQDPDIDVREAAALGLALYHDHTALPELLRMLKCDQQDTALAAAVALQRIGNPEATAALLKAARAGTAEGRFASVRAQAIDSLGLLDVREAVPVLIECLTDERPVTTQPAAERALRRAIEAMGADLAKQGIDPQSLASGRPPVTIADVAVRALRRITGESFGFRSTDPPDRKAAVVRMYEQWWQTHGPGAITNEAVVTQPPTSKEP